MAHAHVSFFTPQIEFQDHDGLVGEHFVYAEDTLFPLLAHIFNRAMCEGSTYYLDRTYHFSIFKSRDPIMPRN